MPINIEVNGTEYTNFTAASATIALDTLANSFSFDAAAPENSFLPFKGGDPCRVLVDGNLVLTGFIENISGSHSASSHVLSISGRDKTGDLIDSSIGVLNDIRAPITLKALIELVIAHIGADLKVIDSANPEPFNKAEDIAAPTPGDNAFLFVEGYAQKRQVLLTSDAEGNVVIINSEPTRGSGAIQHSIDGENNNAIDAFWSYSTEELFNKYIQLGQQDPVALSFGDSTTSDGIVNQNSESIDSNIREGRQLTIIADKGFSQEQLKKRAEWSNKIRSVRSTTYSASVQGFVDRSGNLWKTNELIQVVDDFADINRAMLVNTLFFSYSNSGSVTSLGFVEADAYILKLQEPKPVGTDQDAFKL